MAGSASISPAEGGASAGAPSMLIGEAGSPASCVESGDERCDGRDNDCDGSIDEDACADGCVGFVLEGQSDHGYSYCGISALLLVELGGDAQVLFGANDFSKEGEWRWGPGEPFWRGNASGTAVGDAFTAWSEGVPDDASGNEDCGVLYPLSTTWGDKTCDQAFPYVCEQLD